MARFLSRLILSTSTNPLEVRGQNASEGVEIKPNQVNFVQMNKGDPQLKTLSQQIFTRIGGRGAQILEERKFATI